MPGILAYGIGVGEESIWVRLLLPWQIKVAGGQCVLPPCGSHGSVAISRQTSSTVEPVFHGIEAATGRPDTPLILWPQETGKLYKRWGWERDKRFLNPLLSP